MRSLPLIVVCLASLSSCGDKEQSPQKQIVSQADVLGTSWSIGGPLSGKLSGDELSEIVRGAIVTVEVTGPQAAHRHVRIGGELDTTAGEGVLKLEASFRVSAFEAPIAATVVATGRAETPEQAKTLVRSGAQDLAVALSSLLRLTRGSHDDWIRALDSAEPDEQMLAVALLGRGRVREAVPALGKLLSDPRVPVTEAAADALVEIGDRSAVPLLIESIRRGDLRSEVRAIEAMGRLGGPEARAYLEMAAGGHEVEEVRLLSERALGQLPGAK